MNTVSGLFDRYSNAQWALEVLEIYGVDSKQISVISRGTDGRKPPMADSAGLVALGFTQGETEFYAEGVKRGDILISVATGTVEEYRIRAILRGSGSVEMNTNTYHQTYQDEDAQA
jgi:hypothetical protein